MKKSCKDIERMLVDYADNQLSQIDVNKITQHLVECEECRKLLDALQKSLKLADIIWAEGLTEIENIRIPAIKTKKVPWIRYAAIAACILLVVSVSTVWYAHTRPKARELTFVEIERKITESGSAARLLAAAEMLSENPNTETVVKQQYQYIVEAYPETAAAAKAKLRIR